MTEAEIRNEVVTTAAKYIGTKEGGTVHKQLIDIYNADKPLARGYAMKYTDAWCAAYVSIIAIMCKLTAVIFKECGCDKMIELYQKAGRWKEDDAYKPDAGDIIFYDWDDNGVGDNKGSSDHVGIVEKVSGSTITVIEGNYSDSVKRRTMTVNGKYIRGYGLPDYASVADGKSNTTKSAASGGDTSGLAPASGTADAKTIWNTLMKMIGNAYGVAGLMGNIYAESGLIANNLQNTGNTKTGMSDAEYTAAVDAGTYTNFVKDGYGFGLCQWTYYTRKQALMDYAKAQKASVGNLAMQLQFIGNEMSGSYSTVWNTLKTAKSVREASDAVLLKFERPADMSTTAQEKRASYGQKYFDEYAGSGTASGSTTGTTATASSGTATKEVKASDKAMSFLKSIAGTYTVSANGGLNIRDGAGTSKKVLVTVPNGTKVKNYGYYTTAGGVKWLYVQFTLNSVTYTGFASASYLKK
jgi:hypothetical protein